LQAYTFKTLENDSGAFKPRFNNYYKMAFNFTGKKVLVTGAGQGIGRGIALGLANAGCKVYALDCIQETLDTLAAENSSIVTILQDLANWDETKATLEKLEVLDGLVNNAAIARGTGPALDVKREDIEANFAINVLAGINCIQVVAKKMIEAERGGAIVNISSIASMMSTTNFMSYSVSKAGVDMVTKQFALELGPHKIRVNSVNPAQVATDMFKTMCKEKPGLGEIVLERLPMGRYVEIEEVVGPVMYLLNDQASMVTGTTHKIDGGLSCNITTKQ